MPPLKLSIGDNERRLFKYLEANERITVRELGRLINISDRRASRMLIRLVRAGVVWIHTHEKEEYFTLSSDQKY
jgi:predicted transcriptional regulator